MSRLWTKRSNANTSVVDKSPKLVLSGLPLANPTVGLGAYTIRLIRGLMRSSSAPQFRVLVPAWFDGGMSGVPDSILVRFGSRRRVPHRLLEQMLLSRRLASIVARLFPQAIFHSPAPFWSSTRPARTMVTLHDCIYRHFPLYEGKYQLRRWLNRAAERYAGNASAVLTVSRFSARDLAETTGIPPAKIHVIYNWAGVEFEDVDRIGPESKRVRNKFGLPERFWLYLGRLRLPEERRKSDRGLCHCLPESALSAARLGWTIACIDPSTAIRCKGKDSRNETGELPDSHDWYD